MADSFDALYKVMLLGDGNVGKTSLARQFCEEKFDASRVLTIGVDFQTKIVQFPGKAIKLSIWDVAGQPRFQVVRETFYKGCSAAALVFDLCNLESLKNLVFWITESRKYAPGAKYCVVGNKLDLAGNEKIGDGPLFAKHIHATYIETSAKTGEGVTDMFGVLATLADEKQN